MFCNNSSCRFLRNVMMVHLTTAKRTYKLTLIGAAGGVGQPLTLMLKQIPLIKHLALYDINHVPGVVADVSHIETPTKVTCHSTPTSLKDALECANIVMITAGMAQQPGISRADLFVKNAEIMYCLIKSIAKHCPEALIAIISNPVNSLVPLAAATLCLAKKFDPNKLFGVTTLDCVRANTFVAECIKKNPICVNVPVIGGHEKFTIIPVLSQAKPKLELRDDKKLVLIKKVQTAGDDVVEMKAGRGSATLATAYAGARFAYSLLRGLKGECGVIEASYVRSEVTEAKFFSNAVQLGKHGIEKNLGYGKLTQDEECLLSKCVKQLMKDICLAEEWVKERSEMCDDTCDPS